MRDRPASSHALHPVYAAHEAHGSRTDELHELRVRIPVELHGRLLSLKVLRGKSLADTVSKALDHYFQQRAAEAAAAKAEGDAGPGAASA